jgi:hypothetical protein
LLAVFIVSIFMRIVHPYPLTFLENTPPPGEAPFAVFASGGGGGNNLIIPTSQSPSSAAFAAEPVWQTAALTAVCAAAVTAEFAAIATSETTGPRTESHSHESAATRPFLKRRRLPSSAPATAPAPRLLAGSARGLFLGAYFRNDEISGLPSEWCTRVTANPRRARAAASMPCSQLVPASPWLHITRGFFASCYAGG